MATKNMVAGVGMDIGLNERADILLAQYERRKGE